MDVIFTTLLEAIKASNDLNTGNADINDANHASIRFVKALSVLIDQRIDRNIEERKKFRQVSNADLQGVSILKAAPPPLNEVYLSDISYIQEWMDKYKDWYENKRNQFLNK